MVLCPKRLCENANASASASHIEQLQQYEVIMSDVAAQTSTTRCSSHYVVEHVHLQAGPSNRLDLLFSSEIADAYFFGFFIFILLFSKPPTCIPVQAVLGCGHTASGRSQLTSELLGC